MEKLTDNEIVKALEICSDKLIVSCPDDCPFYDECEKDLYVLKREALDLINRKDAEIERLKEELDGETVKNMRLGHEVERLMKEQLEKELFEGNHYSFHNGKLCAIPKTEEKQIKSEAYKEFAEIVVSDYPETDYYLERILKELTEGGNEE